MAYRRNDNMAKDAVASIDQVEAGLSTNITIPEHSCPICGKAMKDNNSREDLEAGRDLRICSNRACRAKADWTSGVGVMLSA